MPDDNSNVIKVTMEDLTVEMSAVVRQECEAFKNKCLDCFSKNKSGKILQKLDLPKILVPREAPNQHEINQMQNIIQEAVARTMGNHNMIFLNTFQSIMRSSFRHDVDRYFEERFGELSGPTYFQEPNPKSHQKGLVLQDTEEAEKTDDEEDVSKGPKKGKTKATGNGDTTHGDLEFGTYGSTPAYNTYTIAPMSGGLQRNPYGPGYTEFSDYSAINALLNPGYKPSGQSHGSQNANVDILLQRMADMMQNQFGLKPKNRPYMYQSPYLDWYNRVALPSRLKPPSDLTKFSGQDDTTTTEHISRYLIQLGELAVDQAWRIQYFASSLTGPTFVCFTTLPANSIRTWAELEQKFHSYFFSGSNEKELVDLMGMTERYNETPQEFLRRFRETKNFCYSLNLPDHQLPAVAIRGMHPAIREKLVDMEFDDLG
jgi:hypothetical protein